MSIYYVCEINGIAVQYNVTYSTSAVQYNVTYSTSAAYEPLVRVI